jgi:hypothetical protein
MKQRRLHSTVLLVLLPLLTLASCQSVRESPAGRRLIQEPGEFREAPPAVMVDELGVGGIVEYMHPDQLQVEHKTTYPNPFIAPRFILTPIEFLVFRVTFTSLDSGTIIQVNETELRFAGQTDEPAPASTLERFWVNHESNNDLLAHERSQRGALIRSELLAFDVQAGDEPVSGYLVYMGRYPDYGELELRFPIVDRDGRVTDRIVVEMELE